MALLPQELLAYAGGWLRARDHLAISACCRHMHRAMERACVPGLRLGLFPHQLASHRWMQWRERGSPGRGMCVMGGAWLGALQPGGPAEALGESATICQDQTERVCRVLLVSACTPPKAVTVDLLTLEVLSGRTADAGHFTSGGDGRLGTAPRFVRGGLLCDEPGLGKTITVVAALLATAGLQPRRAVWLAADAAARRDALADRAWASLDPTDRRKELLGVMTALRSSCAEWQYALFENPVDAEKLGLHDYHRTVKNPMDLGTVRARASGGEYAPVPSGRGLAAFAQDVGLTFENAMLYNAAPDHAVHAAARFMRDRFRDLMDRGGGGAAGTGLPGQGGRGARRSSTCDGFLSRLGDRLERAARSAAAIGDEAAISARRRRAALLPSAANLIVVPGPLLQHWREQLEMHVDWRFVKFLPPCVEAERAAAGVAPQAADFCGGTFGSCVYVDDTKQMGCKDAPPAPLMARKLIVLTTVDRLSAEQQRQFKQRKGGGAGAGSPKPKRKRKRAKAAAAVAQEDAWGEEDYVSPFNRVDWLRLVLDEAHLGAGLTSNFSMLLSGLDSERVWAMTGTPAKETSCQVTLRNLAGLLRFLRQDPFGCPETRGIGTDGMLITNAGKRAWQELVVEPFVRGRLAAEHRLVCLMKALMVRATKADVPEIPFPIRRLVLLDMSEDEQQYYNTRVSFVKVNLVVSVKPDGRVQTESLLHPKNMKPARHHVNMLRLMCCGGGSQQASITQKYRGEAREVMVNAPCDQRACLGRSRGGQHSVDCPLCWEEGRDANGTYRRRTMIGYGATQDQADRLDRFIGRCITGKQTRCGRCEMPLLLLLVTPCAHMFCPDCMRWGLENTFTARVHKGDPAKTAWHGKCLEPSCDMCFTFDELQLLQVSRSHARRATAAARLCSSWCS